MRVCVHARARACVVSLVCSMCEENIRVPPPPYERLKNTCDNATEAARLFAKLSLCRHFEKSKCCGLTKCGRRVSIRRPLWGRSVPKPQPDPHTLPGQSPKYTSDGLQASGFRCVSVLGPPFFRFKNRPKIVSPNKRSKISKIKSDFNTCRDLFWHQFSV